MTLGKEGLDFFRSFLKNGSYLGRAASQLIQPGDEVVTWFPDGVDIASVSLKEGFGRRQAPFFPICGCLSKTLRGSFSRNLRITWPWWRPNTHTLQSGSRN